MPCVILAQAGIQRNVWTEYACRRKGELDSGSRYAWPE